MRKPYLKLYKEVDGFKAYIVDGTHIRKSNKSFTNFAQHYDFPNMIPPDELWMDRGYGHQDYKYFIANMMAQDELMQQGASYEEADRSADVKERKLRSKEVSFGINKKLLSDADGIGIWLVDGEAVRDKFDVDFGQGGHDLRYSWIPIHEIWIDESIPFDERDKVIERELSERGKISGKMKFIPAYQETSMEETGKKKRRFSRFHLPKPKRPGIKGMGGKRR